MCVAHGCGVAVAAIAKAGTPVGCERLQADIRRSRSREQLYDHAVVAHEPHELQHVEKRASGRPGAWLAPTCSSTVPAHAEAAYRVVMTRSVSCGAQTTLLCMWRVEAREMATSGTADVE